MRCHRAARMSSTSISLLWCQSCCATLLRVCTARFMLQSDRPLDLTVGVRHCYQVSWLLGILGQNFPAPSEYDDPNATAGTILQAPAACPLAFFSWRRGWDSILTRTLHHRNFGQRVSRAIFRQTRSSRVMARWVPLWMGRETFRPAGLLVALWLRWDLFCRLT